MDKETFKHLKDKWEEAYFERKENEGRTKVFSLLLLLMLVIIIGLRMETISLPAWMGLWILVSLIIALYYDVKKNAKRQNVIYEMFMELELNESDKKDKK